MKTETIYLKAELRKGKCICCAEKSNEILIDDGRCIDCIEEDKFYEMTMKNEGTQKNPFQPFG